MHQKFQNSNHHNSMMCNFEHQTKTLKVVIMIPILFYTYGVSNKKPEIRAIETQRYVQKGTDQHHTTFKVLLIDVYVNIALCL